MNRFTRIALAAVFTATLSLSAGAECQDDWREKMETEKIAFITSEMDLTPSEAQDFWPVYNEVQKVKRRSLKEVFDAYKALEDAVASGKGVEEALEKYLAVERDSHAVDSKYLPSYLKVIPAEKVGRLYIGEEKFRRQQIHRLRGGAKGNDRPKGGKK